MLTQCRPELIERTYECLQGANDAIVHFYNSTSVLQRRVVFGLDKDGITQIATDAAKLCRKLEPTLPGTNVRYEYSPESFTGTEIDYAIEICAAVIDVIEPDTDRQLILNLPATVEMYTPNIYGDVIEYFHRNVPNRDRICLSLHPHNDQGTGVAAAEFGIMAGADRVEGTLFGNGERTGNVDVINLAMNLFSQGVDPELDITDIDALRRVAEYCNRLPVHPRHPYVGDLVYTSFSGSHQDAIKKGFEALGLRRLRGVGRARTCPSTPSTSAAPTRRSIRVNSQTGKGGVAYMMKAEHGLDLPRRLQIEFSKTIQTITEDTGTEIPAAEMWAAFEDTYLDPDAPVQLLSHETTTGEKGSTVTAQLLVDGEHRTLHGGGHRPARRLRGRAPGRPRHRPRGGRLQRARGQRRHRRHRRRPTWRPSGRRRGAMGRRPGREHPHRVAAGRRERRQPPPRPRAPGGAPRALTGTVPGVRTRAGIIDHRRVCPSCAAALRIQRRLRGRQRRGAGVRRRLGGDAARRGGRDFPSTRPRPSAWPPRSWPRSAPSRSTTRRSLPTTSTREDDRPASSSGPGCVSTEQADAILDDVVGVRRPGGRHERVGDRGVRPR